MKRFDSRIVVAGMIIVLGLLSALLFQPPVIQAASDYVNTVLRNNTQAASDDVSFLVELSGSTGDFSVGDDLTVGGWIYTAPVTIAATPYTISSTSKAAGYNNSYTSTGAASTMLPVTPTDGALITITDTGDASSNNLTVGGGAATINGAATYVMNAQYESATFRYDSGNTNWNIIGAYLE